MFRYNWFYRLVRRYTEPIDYDKADIWKKRLALGYGFLAWNIFGFICFQYYKGNGDWAKAAGLKTEADVKIPVAAQYADILGIKNANVTKISGLRKVGEYDIVEGQITPLRKSSDVQPKTENEELMT